MPTNALQRALVSAGLAEEPKEKRKRYKKFTCNRCGEVMTRLDGTNFMYCPQCDYSYFIFSK